MTAACDHALTKGRLARMKALGLVAADAEPFGRMPGEPAWEDLNDEAKECEARKMEIYAAMIDDVDRHLGRLIDYLKQIDEYENTAIIFLSDNGPEGHDLGGGGAIARWADECCDNRYENIGKANSYIWYGQNWGQAGNSPARLYKGFTSQGGIRVPAFAHFPKSIRSNATSNAMTTVRDVMPTILELARVNHPGRRYRDRDVEPMQGKSMLAMLRGDTDTVHDSDTYFGWELFGKRAIRRGDWKIIYVPYHEVREPRPAGIETDRWQLYNLAEDPSEKIDLSERFPEKRAELIALWEDYQRENGVILPDKTSGY